MDTINTNILRLAKKYKLSDKPDDIILLHTEAMLYKMEWLCKNTYLVSNDDKALLDTIQVHQVELRNAKTRKHAIDRLVKNKYSTFCKCTIKYGEHKDRVAFAVFSTNKNTITDKIPVLIVGDKNLGSAYTAYWFSKESLIVEPCTMGQNEVLTYLEEHEKERSK